MGFEGAVMNNFLKSSCEVQRIWVEVTLLGFLKEVLDSDIYDIEESGREGLVVLLKVAVGCLFFLDVEENRGKLLDQITCCIKNYCK